MIGRVTATLLLLIGGTCALQFLLANKYIGDAFSPTESIAMDFTVYSRISISAIGFVDADDRGINGTLFASVVDRSTGLVTFTTSNDAGEQRESDANPFVFRPLAARLEPGIYSLVATGFILDRIISSNVTTGNGSAVVATAALRGKSSDLSAPLAIDVSTTYHVGATFVYEIDPVPPVVSLMPTVDFPHCEAVACAGLPTGAYKILGQMRYCDNDAAGGGWLRVWRANDSTCEDNGWSSGRRLDAQGLDPAGCRPAVSQCSNSTRVKSPFPFREVRGDKWRLWGVGTLGAFHSRALCDGVVVWGGNEISVGSVMWAFALSGSVSSGHCPCNGGFVASANTNASLATAGSNWSCASLPARSTVWVSAFDAIGDNCTGTGMIDSNMFQRSFDELLTTLSVGLCRNGNDSTEDIKLASGDLFVRATTGFDKVVSCARVTHLASLPALSTTTTTVQQIVPAQSTSSRLAATTASSPPLVVDPTMPIPSFPLAAVVGGSVGGLAVLVGAIVVAFVCWKRRSAVSSAPARQPAIANEYGVFPPAALANSEPQLYDDVAAVRGVANEYESTAAPLEK